jgi:DNA replication and repair protein RecF
VKNLVATTQSAVVESQDTGLRRCLSVSSISLHHFRNYESLRVESNGQPVVLYGRNGAGKTNILEALSLLTPGRGLRKAKLSEIDRIQQKTPWVISASVTGAQGSAQIGTGRVEEEGVDKRLVKIDGKPLPHTHLSKYLAMLWLTPQMEQLFLEGASAGRKFLDRLVYNFDPEHATRINAYDYAMRERNKLLEIGSTDKSWLGSLEETMAGRAVEVADARLATVHSLNNTIIASKLSFPKARLNIEGFAETRLQSGVLHGETKTDFQRMLAEGRGRDAAAGRTLAGAHRSELKVLHLEKHMPAEGCSTGEQKALLLSIVLSQARATANQKGIVPVLLFDEVAAHLDPIRRLELFEEICQIGAQTWMTGTDANLFLDMKGKATFFQVDNGIVIPAQAGILKNHKIGFPLSRE